MFKVITGALASLILSSACMADSFSLTSKSVADGERLSNEQVFSGFGCSGENVSPDLQWQSPPAGTKSFALTVYDPDAPTGSGWWHWLVYDIPADVQSLKKGAGAKASDSLPDGAKQGRSDFGYKGFGGACPPAGHKPHRYQFTIYALSTESLGVPEDASAAMIGFMINANVLGKATFTAFYGR